MQRRLPASGQQRGQAAQFVVDEVAQRGFGLLQIGPLVAARQPGFAAREHGLQQLGEARRVVVEAFEHALQALGQGAIGVEQAQRFLGGAAVVGLGVGGDAGLAAQAREQRHLARQLAAERV